MTDTTDNTATTSDATVQNTDAATSGAVTDAAQQTQAQTQTDITQTPEFKAAVTAAMEKKIPQLKRQIAKEISGENEPAQVSSEDLQRQLSDTTGKLRSYEARDTVEAYLLDGRNKLNINPANIRGIQRAVIPYLEYDEDGKPTNLKEAIDTAKVEAPALFANQPSSINANNGTQQPVNSRSMNDFIRQAAGFGN